MVIIFLATESAYLDFNDNITYNNASFSFTPDSSEINPLELYTDIIETASEKGVVLFKIRQDTSLLVSKTTIVTSPANQEIITDQLNIDDNSIKSLIFPKFMLEYDEPLESDIAYGMSFRLFNSDENFIEFLKELESEHEITINNFSNAEFRISTYTIIIYVLSVILLLFMGLLSYIDVTYQKKEVFVSVSLGSNLKHIILKKLLINALAFSVIYIIGYFMLGLLVQVSLITSFIGVLFLATIVSTSLPYLSLCKFNYKSVIYGHMHSNKILSLNYLLKMISISFTVICVSFAMSNSQSFYKYIQTKNFFNDYPNHSFCNIYLPTPPDMDNPMALLEHCEEQDELIDKLLEEYSSEFNPIYIEKLEENYRNSSENLSLIMCNKNATEYLKTVLPELNDMEFNGTEPVVALSTQMSKELQEKYLDKCKTELNIDAKPYYYEKNAEILSINSDNVLKPFDYTANPAIVILDSTKENMLNKPSCMINVNSQLQTEIMGKYKLKVEPTNASSVFNFAFKINIATYIFMLVLTISLFIFNIILISSIIKIEYEVNAIEFSIKKILGYTIFQRNSFVFLVSIFCIILSTLISIVFCKSVLDISLIFPIITLFAITFFECVAIKLTISKVEKANLIKILKGGAL